MPLLKREAEISPLNLFEMSEAQPPWWVAHTRSRQEKKFARYLGSSAVPFYLPQRAKRIERRGRKLESHLPLFPGYVFFRGELDHRHLALRSRLLVQILPVTDQFQLHRELARLRELQECGASLVPLDELEPGDEVQVTQGPFQGYSGVVIRGQVRLRLQVSISMLRKTLAVEFDRSVLTHRPSHARPGGDQRAAVA